MRLAVAAETLQAHQPRGLDVHDLVFGFVVDRAAVDGLGGLVHQFDVQRLRVDLTHTVGLSVSGEAVDKHRDVRLDIGPDQAELIVFHKSEGAFFRKFVLRFRCEFGEERPVQICRAILPAPSAEECHAADEQPALRVVQPAYRPQLQKDPVPFRRDGSVGKLQVSVGPALFQGQDDHLLGSEAVDRLLCAADCDVASRVAQRAFRKLLLCEVAQTPIQDRRGIQTIVHRGDGAVFPLMLQQRLFARFQQERRPKGTGCAWISPSEAVHAGIPGEIIIHPAAGLMHKAVVRHGQESEV